MASITNIVVTVILIAALLPVAFDLFFGANTTAWDTATVALWALIPIFVAIGIFLRFAPKGGGAT